MSTNVQSQVLRKICCKRRCTNLEITWYTRDSLACDLFVFINNAAYFTRVSLRLKFLDPWTLLLTNFCFDTFFITSKIHISKIIINIRKVRIHYTQVATSFKSLKRNSNFCVNSQSLNFENVILWIQWWDYICILFPRSCDVYFSIKLDLFVKF